MLDALWEAGIDAGGLTRDWFQEILDTAFSAEMGMFKFSQTDNITYQIDEMSSAPTRQYRFVGLVLGKAILDGLAAATGDGGGGQLERLNQLLQDGGCPRRWRRREPAAEVVTIADAGGDDRDERATEHRPRCGRRRVRHVRVLDARVRPRCGVILLRVEGD